MISKPASIICKFSPLFHHAGILYTGVNKTLVMVNSKHDGGRDTEIISAVNEQEKDAEVYKKRTKGLLF